MVHFYLFVFSVLIHVFDVLWDDLVASTIFTGDETDIIKKLEQIPPQQFMCSSGAQLKSVLHDFKMLMLM